MAKRLLAIGECLIEFAHAGAEDYRQSFGGDAFVAARVARRALGPIWRVGCLTAVGNDPWSDRLVARMETEGIETDHVARLPGRAPGLRVTERDPGAPPRISYWCETSAARALADQPEALETAISGANAVFFSGVTLGILAPDARGQLLSALDRAKARGTAIAFDGRWRSGLWPDRGALRAAIRAAARVATIAIPAVDEEVELFGEAGAEAVAARYRSDGCVEVLLRPASSPALLLWPDGRAETDTAAGDAGGFGVAYLAARVTGAAPEAALARAATGRATPAPA